MLLLKNLNNLVSGYLEFAERQAEKEIVMYMKDWVEHIDKILKAVGEDILQGNGKITNQEMSEKVEIEYKKFREKNLTQVEKDYLEEIKEVEESVEHGQDNGQCFCQIGGVGRGCCGVVAHKAAYHVNEGIEEYQHPNHTKHVKH